MAVSSQFGASRGFAIPGSWRSPHTHYIHAMDSEWFRALVVFQDVITVTTATFWRSRGVRTLHLPITTGSISSPMGLGSDSKPVAVNLHGVDTYLADSMQFMLEYGCRLNENGTYYVMPSFRGEDADATHLCQFFHSEAEVPGGLDDVIAVVEQYLLALTKALVEEEGALVERVAGGLGHVENLLDRDGELRRLTFDEASALLGDDARFVVTHTEDHGKSRTLTRAGEHELMRRLGQFVWVTDFDHLAVPFYQAYTDDSMSWARNADLLFGAGETVGAGERHMNGDDTRRALAAHGVAEAPYEWYIAMKDLRPMRTSGFGLGIERYLMWLLQHDDIRDMQLLPRFNGVDIVP
jgi:asparaginyl-tRNA synthetase